jgi:hypothetical protein
MTPLDWNLVEIWSHYGRLLDNLNTWRNSQGKVLFPAIATIKKQAKSASILERLHKQDQQYDGLIGRYRGWRYAAGTALLALQWLYRGKVLELHETGALPEHQTWQMLNCQPSGGHWVADRFGTEGTGAHCESSLCPWCYLREFNMHVERIRTMFTPNKKLREATISLYKVCPSPVKALEDADHRLLQVYIGNSLRRKLTTSAYRLMGYPYIVSKGKRLPQSVSYSVRVGYFTPEPLDWGEFQRNVKVKNEVRQVHFENIPELWIDHGVRHVWPYPVDLLGASCETIVKYLEFRRRRRDYGVVRPPKKNDTSTASEANAIP